MGTDYPRLFLGWSSALRGRHDEAIAELQKAVVDREGAIFPTAALGQAYAVAGQEGAAREVLCRLLARSKTEGVSAHEIAGDSPTIGFAGRQEWLTSIGAPSPRPAATAPR